LHNLLGLSSSDVPAAHRYLNAILAIEPDSAQHHWLRAIVRRQLELGEGSQEDVDWLLDKKPPGLDYERILQLERSLEQLR
jgi:serine protease Do